MIIGNILNEDEVNKAVEGSEIVYNFAGIADIAEANKSPISTIKTNVLGNTIVLDACRKASVSRFVFASTLYVYSAAGLFYRSSKQSSELIIENFSESYDLPYTILRYGSVYGPRAKEGNYVFNILRQAITEGKITSFGKPNDLRDFIHAEDAARLSVEVLSEEFKNQYVILAGNQSIRRNDLLVMIREMLSNNIDIEFVPVESNLHYEVTPYSFGPKLAKRLMGNHHIDLGQGILQCLHEIHAKENPDKEGLIIEV